MQNRKWPLRTLLSALACSMILYAGGCSAVLQTPVGELLGHPQAQGMNQETEPLEQELFVPEAVPLAHVPNLPASTNPNEYTFAWMSDTQLYSRAHPEIFSAMTGWLAANAQPMNIKFLVHTGDLVHVCESGEEWQNANAAMSLLDGHLRYSIVPGNHDLAKIGDPTATFLRYYGGSRWGSSSRMQWFEGGIGNMQIIDTGNREYLFLSLGYNPSAQAIQWANDRLAEHPELIAILSTHNYMRSNGELSDTGRQLYDQIVVKNPNVRLVLCGHNHEAQSRASFLDDNGDGQPDRAVTQLLADYQAATENGGDGYLRLLTVDEVNQTLRVRTYSPWLDDYDFYDAENFPGKDTFDIDISDWW